MKIVFFSPNAFIGVHAIPEALVARALGKSGHDVTYVNCNRAYRDNCVSMSAAGLNFYSSQCEKDKVCDECILRRDSIINKFKLNSIIINEYMNDNDMKIISPLIECVNRFNWHEFSYEGIPVGKYAAYEFLLNFKISKITFTDQEFVAYKSSLINTLRTLFAAKRIFDKFSPDKIAVYNSFYSLNNMFCSLAKKRDLDYYTLHSGSHLKDRVSMLTIFRGNLAASLITRSSAWPVYRDYPLNKQKIKKVHSHLCELFEGRSPWVYSIKAKKMPSYHIRQILGIPDNRKVILATLSSIDESFAGFFADAIAPYQNPIFETQDEWIEYLIKFAKSNKEVILVIRPHPREYPNKREGVLSQRARELEAKLSQLPDNVRVNYPSQNIALHDLLKLISLGLTMTSTTGIDFMLHGIPVINCDSGRILAYPNELHIVAESAEDYSHKIKLALRGDIEKPNIVLIYKWFSFLFEVVQIDISDVFKIKHPNYFSRIISFGKRKLGFKNLLFGFNINNIDNFQNKAWLTFAIENQQESCLEERVKLFKRSKSTLTDIEAKNYINSKLKNLI